MILMLAKNISAKPQMSSHWAFVQVQHWVEETFGESETSGNVSWFDATKTAWNVLSGSE